MIDPKVRPRRQAGLWGHPDFLKLWAGQSISELGSGITGYALPFLAILTLGATPAQMGVLSALGSLPVFLIGLFAGVWTDRLPRRPILIAADLARALILASIPAAALLGVLGIGHLYAVILLAGVFTVFFNVAYRAYLPILVSRDNLVEGNSKLAVSSSVAEVAGPSLAGVLVQTITAPMVILVDSASFLVSAASVFAIRRQEPGVAGRPQRQTVLRELRDGFQATISHPVLRALTGSVGTLSFFGGFYAVLYSLYGIRVLGLSAALIGVTISVGGASSLAGALLAGWAVRRLGLARTLIGSLLLYGLVGFLIPAAGGPVPLAAAMLMAAQLLGDALRTVYFIHETSLRQAITPDHLLGRVNASTEFVAAGLGTLGALAGGVLGEGIGPRAALYVAAAGMVLAAAWPALSPIRRLAALDAAAS